MSRNLVVEGYRKAAEQGDAEAQFELGFRYDDGLGVEQSYEKAVKWYRKAAEQGHAEAQFYLGCCYDDGLGVEQSYEKAVKWYRKAAEQGDAEAQFKLGVGYYNGLGVEQSYEKAYDWFRKAAEQGLAEAQFNLGCCYDDGLGVEQSYEKAVKWYRKAAEQGAAKAQCNLGVCYYKGQGVERSYEKAYDWFRKAAEQGNANAQKALKILSGHKLSDDNSDGYTIEQNNEQISEVVDYLEKGLCNHRKDEYEEIEDEYEAAIPLGEEIEDEYEAAIPLGELFRDDVTRNFNGKRVFIYSKAAKKCATAMLHMDFAPLYCCTDHREAWEIYSIEVDNEGRASFRAFNGLYLSVDFNVNSDYPPVTARGSKSDAWEKFRIYKIDSGYAIKAIVNDKWVSCRISSPGKNQLYATCERLDWWETFDIITV